MKKKYLILLILIIIPIALAMNFTNHQSSITVKKPLKSFVFESIDTMKYSRDVSREKLNDPSFDVSINQQAKLIAQTGATHMAIDTPYDEEFYPILKRWVKAARKNNLNVWFRGNWSGWEGWFDYPQIGREEHLQKTKDFILDHRDIFKDGDVFTPCPECENGGPGDPRQTGDIQGHRKFLIDEYKMTKQIFKQINKNVISNYDSMNGDVATQIMDRQTTKALDGVITIDHYVQTPEELVEKVNELTKATGGKIVFGELGAPIPDINGEMTQEEQQAWLLKALSLLKDSKSVIGINYWTDLGSSTALWNDDLTPKKAVGTITEFFIGK